MSESAERPEHAEQEPPYRTARAAVGQGIETFALMELGLSNVYAALMAPAEPVLAFLTLENARHFETKHRIVSAVGRAALEGEILATFNNLMNRAKNRAGIRHKMAHWQVQEIPAERTKGGKATAALFPPFFSSACQKVASGEERPVHIGEMHEAARLCRQLHVEMGRFSDLIRAKSREK